MPPPILTPSKTPTENPSIVLPKKLYTSAYFLCSSMPNIPYIPLWFATPIMTQAHALIYSPQKWLESNIDVQYISINFITHATTPHYPNDSVQIFVLSLLNHYSAHPRQEKTALIPIWSIPSQIHLWLQKPAFSVTSSMISTLKLYYPAFQTTKKLNICSLMSTVHTPTIQQTVLPPIIHHMLSTTPHTSTRHPIKTHHNSRPS